MKKMYSAILVVALLLSGLVISGWQNKDITLAKTQSQRDLKAELDPKARTKAPETHVVYSLLFKQIIDINQKARAEKASGQSVITFQTMRQSLKRQLNLTDADDLILDKIATDCASEADLIDQQAEEIIKSFWAKYPQGTVFDEKNRPRTPKELDELQDKHDGVILKYRDRLRQQLGVGSASFDNFESALYRNFGSKITTVLEPSPTRSIGVSKKIEQQ